MEEKKVRELIHDISNDLVVLQGLISRSTREIDKKSPEEVKETLARSMDRLSVLAKRIHEFRGNY